MAIYYSPSSGGFYRESIHGKNMPTDVVEVTEDHHQHLMQKQSEGKKIAPNADGYPQAVNPSLDAQKQSKTSKLRQKYNSVLETGFTYDGGSFPATGSQRRRIVELVAQVNAGKGLPNGKSTVRFVDQGGTAHDFGPSDVVEVGSAGNDLVDAADDRYGEIEAMIVGATSDSELPSDSEIASGWPIS